MARSEPNKQVAAYSSAGPAFSLRAFVMVCPQHSHTTIFVLLPLRHTLPQTPSDLAAVFFVQVVFANEPRRKRACTRIVDFDT